MGRGGGTRGTFGGEAHSWGLAIAAKGGQEGNVTSRSLTGVNGGDRSCRRRGALQSWGASACGGAQRQLHARAWGASGEQLVMGAQEWMKPAARESTGVWGGD